MYVKTLTLKGFKSFASATTMRLEPGITCIVGPNGSGKSNVVDALAWVMGEQGAKSLRGGKMEDVIFAGTAGRAPLGRAEVSLTIDNTDGALPIDYTEVTITRTMFRNGGSDYAINGTPSRLLDIQELLSDSGIGREMHVIVGQGQLDTILRATPEERRGFIEEAAGVLKHRKRKERALRKLEAMEANLTRVADLTGEIRRQLGPLGRQAEAARKAAVIQAEARDARLRLLADDLVQLTSTLEQEVADETALIARRSTLEQTLTDLRSRLTLLEDESAAAAPLLAQAHDRWGRFQSLRDRLDSTGGIARERMRLLGQDDADETTTGRDPEELRAQAAQARENEAALLAEVAAALDELKAAVSLREDSEKAYAAEQARLSSLARAAADRREGLAKLAGQVGARRSRIEAREAEIGRLEGIVAASLARAAEAEKEFAALESTVADDEEGEVGLDGTYEVAEAQLADLEGEIESLLAAERDADRDRASAKARLEALELSLRRRDGAAVDVVELLGGVERGGVQGFAAVQFADFALDAAVDPAGLGILPRGKFHPRPEADVDVGRTRVEGVQRPAPRGVTLLERAQPDRGDADLAMEELQELRQCLRGHLHVLDHDLLGPPTTQPIEPAGEAVTAIRSDDLPVHVAAFEAVGPEPPHCRILDSERRGTPEPVGVPAPQVVERGQGVGSALLDGAVVDLLAGVVG